MNMIEWVSEDLLIVTDGELDLWLVSDLVADHVFS